MSQVLKKDFENINSYNQLLSLYPLRKINSEQENEYYLSLYQELLDIYEADKNLSFIEDYLDILTILIDKFEETQYQIQKTSGVDVLKFIIKQHDLKQKDLSDVFGTQSVLSEILNGKRSLNLNHIRLLSERFNLNPSVFV